MPDRGSEGVGRAVTAQLQQDDDGLWMFSTTKNSSRPWRGKMRKALAELNEDERHALLYVADLGTAACLSGLIVSIIKLVGDLL